jgi:hypothetical protein
MFMSGDQNAGQNLNVKTDNKSYESLEQFPYFRKNLSSQNSMQEETTSRLNSGNSIIRPLYIPTV